MKKKKSNDKVNVLLGGGLTVVFLCVLLVVFLKSGGPSGEGDEVSADHEQDPTAAAEGAPAGVGGGGRRTTAEARTTAKVRRSASPRAAAAPSPRPAPATSTGASAPTGPTNLSASGAPPPQTGTPKPLHTGPPPKMPGQPQQAWTYDPVTKRLVPYPTLRRRAENLERDLARARQSGDPKKVEEVSQELKEVQRAEAMKKKKPPAGVGEARQERGTPPPEKPGKVGRGQDAKR